MVYPYTFNSALELRSISQMRQTLKYVATKPEEAVNEKNKKIDP